MTNVVLFWSEIATCLQSFLLSYPIHYFTGMVLLLFLVKVLKSLFHLTK